MNSTTKGSSNLQHRRHRSEISSRTECPRSSEEATQDIKAKAMKTSKSFHAASSVTRKQSGRTLPKKKSTSFNCGATLDRQCSVHPEVSLGGDDDACPKCSINLMRIAAKTLERRAAELELQRTEREAEEKARNKAQRRKGRARASCKESTHKSLDNETAHLRANEINDLMHWASGFETKGSNPMPPGPSSKGRCHRRKFSIGQVAQPSEIEEPTFRTDMLLIKIARLKEGDGAWVKRSDNVWTYATLKARKSGPDATLNFTVNERGSVKKFPVTAWAKFVRLIVDSPLDDDDESEPEEEEEEEGDIDDLMTSHDQLFEPSPNQVGHAFEKSLDTFASEPTTGSADSVSSNFSERSYEEEKGRALVVQDREAPRYVPYKEHSPRASYEEDGQALPLRDQEVPAIYVPNDRDEGEVELQDHDLSMWTLGLQDESLPPNMKYDSIPEEEDEAEPHVSFKIPHDEGQTSNRTSMTSVLDEELCVDYDADAEENCESDPSLNNKGAGKIKEILHRSRSLPIQRENRAHEEKNRRPKRRTPNNELKHRVSWSEDVDQFKEEIKLDTKKSNAPSDMNITKKNLKELDMGKLLSQHHGRARHSSFHSALKSIHRRSSVMMPPSSSVAANLNKRSSVMMWPTSSVAVNLN